ncbi:hypothetical protein [Marinobacter sp. ELB17]|uniref:hypothetical protein n=1 Tax=Marinobacter sp. ELB17 TaxID=270374 RepID=UPI0000F3AC9A|nr:hypothetical protein [Marinobacter sp. ELB17]EAZ99083.1 hypothetical protein MELB17_05894 [Marinobacter sp. ELB17]
MGDGLLDDSERDVFRSALTKMAEYNMLDFSIERGMEDIMNLADQWREGDRAEVEAAALEALRQLRGKEKLGELIANTTVSAGVSNPAWQAGVKSSLNVSHGVQASYASATSELKATGSNRVDQITREMAQTHFRAG